MEQKIFYDVCLYNEKKRNYILYALVIFTVVAIIFSFSFSSIIERNLVLAGLGGIISSVSSLIFLTLFFSIIFGVWVLYFLYRKKSKKKINKPDKKVIEALEYFIEANNLYETQKDDTGKSTIINSARLGYWENEEEFIIRAYKQADKFNEKMNVLDNSLSALTGFPVENKIDTIKYCDYYFKKKKFERIIVEGNASKNKNTSTFIPLNSQLRWNILKQPHMLLAGVTGSGKTTFLNYLIIEMKKMQADVYVCDPKRSDLSSLQHFWGKEYVASDTNNIAKLTRVVKEIMNNRFLEYKENAENFVYGNSYVDYGLKPVFLLFDELGAFRAGADKKVFSETMANLTEIILKGREMGVFAILSTQQPNANNIPTELRDNLSVRLALGNMSNEAYRMVFGETEGLQTISEKGAGYIYLDGLGWENPKYFEAPYLDYKKFNFIEEIQKYN
ncbi:FtsK/SpoIIIE domain-containing protein [Ruminococcus sp.]|uniref:FtsK/SpoIIIE domain-containing protein n=1 Tax=Ruminococcus sp. TaxID=41978 RepID=UPI0025E5B4FF|nr:FtsK/SpoIIIE domain-containing protein [Ruminococcus sp.]MCI6616421.1 hypothetical protein [Ruminococcus sp.]MDD6990072.1 FtsK/SpoIIIE domain-containing protein [Ruminococcus sp.]MDY6202028.1 FtsK/SpoIIIE domain-containing protein [Ruminococcus sp.]